MERKDIGFTGLGLAVSDLDAADGELSVSHNIIRDNGAMRPVLLPEEELSLEEGERLLYVHRVQGRKKNYIVEDNGSLFFFTDENASRIFMTSIVGLKDIESIGNTLIVSLEDGIHYMLFKDGRYKDLGTKPPETVIKFSLESYLMESESGFTMEEIETEQEGSVVTVKEADMSHADTLEQASVNKLIADATDSNRIVYPCFVRYAYRLYDGTSYIMHSSPILLVPNTDIAPVVCGKYLDGDYDEEWKAMVMASKVKVWIEGNDLSDWSDIVQSIDIFMSEQVSTRNFGGSEEIHISKLSDTSASESTNYGWFSSFLLGTVPAKFIDLLSPFGGENVYRVVLYDDSMRRKDLMSAIRNVSNFYKVRSIPVDNTKANQYISLFEDEDDESGAGSGANLSSVVSGERLPDDYQTHDTLVVNSIFSYNARLNASGVKRVMFGGYNTASMVADFLDYTSGGTYYTVYTHIKKNGQEIVVKNDSGRFSSFYPLYLFYPDKDAYRMTIIEGQHVQDGAELVSGYIAELTSHPYLNGAVYFNNLKPVPRPSSRRLTAPYVTNSIVDVANKVYTSEVNNPFYFPLEGINTVGTGDIIGMASITKALSQGQFGQFPLYVFSSDGIWAMEVGQDGLYSSVKPLSRDVCINGESITQTDNAVLFVSEKGVMMIDGSNVNCISEMMNGRSFDVDSVGMLDNVMAKEGVSSGLNGMVDFMEYARSARMAYDYPNGRVVLFKEGEDYVYLFSLESGTWATIGVSLERAVTDYPDVYVQSGSSVINLSGKVDYDDGRKVKTLLVTRPVKMDDDGYKTVYEMVAAGAMDRRLGAVLLWGSHDGLEYVLIKAVAGNRMYRTGGSGYRYFRIGVVGNMTVGEKLSMVSLLFRRKYGNRLR